MRRQTGWCGVFFLALVGCAAPSWSQEPDVPRCSQGDYGYFGIAGNEKDGYYIMLTEHPVRLNGENETEVDVRPMCIVGNNDQLYVMGPGKEARAGEKGMSRTYGEVRIDAGNQRRKAVSVFSLQ